MLAFGTATLRKAPVIILQRISLSRRIRNLCLDLFVVNDKYNNYRLNVGALYYRSR
jgi:hypothetical protein